MLENEPGRSRASRPAERVVRIVELFAAEPTRRFTLSQICEELGLSISTVHSILNTLTARQWVVRNPASKLYALGPALVRAAQGSKAVVPGLPEVERTVDQLSAQLDVVCAASRREGDEVVIVAQAQPVGTEDPATRIGQRVPFGAPFGSGFAAWAGSEEIEGWFQRSALDISSTEADLYRHIFDGIRRRGYGVERLDRAQTLLHEALVEFQSVTMSTLLLDRIREVLPFITIRELLPEDLDRGSTLDIAMVHSQVFDADGDAVFNLSVHLRRSAVPADEVHKVGRLIADAAHKCSQELSGVS